MVMDGVLIGVWNQWMELFQLPILRCGTTMREETEWGGETNWNSVVFLVTRDPVRDKFSRDCMGICHDGDNLMDGSRSKSYGCGYVMMWIGCMSR
jgi:hypothetical protein